MAEVDPWNLLAAAKPSRVPRRRASLFWGKAAHRFRERVEALGRVRADLPELVISPLPPPSPELRLRWIQGEHPLPGEGSFRAGEALLEQLDSLRRFEVNELEVFLSGGASSLAWVPTVSRSSLNEELCSLYARPLSISELNEARGRLCALKQGGAAAWLRRLAPGVRARVTLLSDVYPYGPQVVGSGPFRDGRIPHRVLADNRTWTRALCREARRRGDSILSCSSGRVAPLQAWVDELASRIRRAGKEGKTGAAVLGGEPLLVLPAEGRGRGGRMSHLAAALALSLLDLFEKHELEIHCLASDGADGDSMSSGAFLGEAFRERVILRNRATRELLREALRNFDTGSLLAGWGALLAPGLTGTNVQDGAVVVLR